MATHLLNRGCRAGLHHSKRRKLVSTAGKAPTMCSRSGHASSDAVTEWLQANLGGTVTRRSSMGSSSWSSASLYEMDNGQAVFVKQSRNGDETMFKGEALGLQAMYDTQTVRVPRVYHYGSLSSVPGGGSLGGDGSFIIMERLDFGGQYDPYEFGTQLAQMHLAPPLDAEARQGKFGFAVDNTIGGTPQLNGWMDNWVDFYRERRLRYQLELAGDAQLQDLGAKLMANLGKIFKDIEVKPSCLHGDLWSGNIAAVKGNGVAIFDPAVYYGHHESEFGMSWCAGFSHDFYRGYHSLIPKAPGFEERRKIYLLYHYLNHYNLFGSGYYGECKSLLSQLTRGM